MSGAFPALVAAKYLDSRVGQTIRSQNEAAAHCLFERELGVEDRGIFLERSRESLIERESVRMDGNADRGGDNERESFHRPPPKVDGGATTSAIGFPGESLFFFAANPSACGSRAQARANRASATL